MNGIGYRASRKGDAVELPEHAGMSPMANANIELLSVVVHEEQQVSAELDGEIVVLNMNDSKYYGLDEAGAFIWSFMEEPCRVDAIVDAMLESYEVSREACEADVLAFVRQLRNVGLIRVVA